MRVMGIDPGYRTGVDLDGLLIARGIMESHLNGEPTHGAYISDLSSGDQTAVFDALERWTGVTIGQSAADGTAAVALPPREPPVRVYLPPRGMRR